MKFYANFLPSNKLQQKSTLCIRTPLKAARVRLVFNSLSEPSTNASIIKSFVPMTYSQLVSLQAQRPRHRHRQQLLRTQHPRHRHRHRQQLLRTQHPRHRHRQQLNRTQYPRRHRRLHRLGSRFSRASARGLGHCNAGDAFQIWLHRRRV